MTTTEQRAQCTHCNTEFSGIPDTLCDDCEDNTSTCDDCDTRVDRDDLWITQTSNYICSDCRYANYGACDDCDDIAQDRNLYQCAGRTLCEDCLCHYETCTICGRESFEDDSYFCENCEDSHCNACYDGCSNRNIHGYGYKPSPNFIGAPDDRLYLGVELEIDQGNIDVTGELTEIDPGENLFYLKEDGSLGSSGVEIVTHPATLEAHLDGTIPWQSIIATAKKFGYTSHSAKTCGLHVHLSRAGLGETPADQDATLSNMILLLWRHWPNIQNLSRRTISQLHWCQPNHEAVSDFSPSKVDDAKNVGRYVALNNTNSDTVELRLFRGTLRWETIVATLQFSQHLVNYCKGKEAIAIVTGTWSEFIADTPQEFRNYVEARQCA